VPAKRHPHHDYASAGAYFVTVCTRRRALIFEIPGAAHTVQRCWDEMPSHFAVELDAFVVMPNHVHGIVMVGRAGHARPLQVVIGSCKSAVSRLLGRPVWQRGFYERVIRDERELEALREYIVNNPAVWDVDRENPSRPQRAASIPWL
jgi:putative transposase